MYRTILRSVAHTEAKNGTQCQTCLQFTLYQLLFCYLTVLYDIEYMFHFYGEGDGMPESDTTGFPNPATDHAESSLDLHQYAVRHPQATFFWRAEGDAMRDAGISSGDVLVVDRAVQPVPGQVVVATVGGEFLVRRWRRDAASLVLYAEHPAYPPLVIQSDEECQIVGVVIYVLHDPNRGRL